MASSHHPGINSTLLLHIKRVTVHYWHTLEYGAKWTSFYWLAVRNANGTDIKRLHTFCGLNWMLLELEVIETATWQGCCDLSTHPQAPTHFTFISQETLQLFHNCPCSTGSHEDEELPSLKGMRSQTQEWEEMFSVICLYLVPLKMKSLWSLDLKICHISWAQKLVLVKWENSKEKQKREVPTLIKCISIDTSFKTHHLDLNFVLILLPLVA